MTDIEKERSIGIIPVLVNSEEPLFLLVKSKLHGHWGLPKGHSEPNETEKETAKRELLEETGIEDIEINSNKEFNESYSFTKNGTKYNKNVKYFIGYLQNKDNYVPEDFKEEIQDNKWVTYKEIMNKPEFEKARAVVEKAYNHLKENDNNE